MQEASQRLTELQLLKPRVVAVLGFDPTAVSGALPGACGRLLNGPSRALPQLELLLFRLICCRSLTDPSS